MREATGTMNFTCGTCESEFDTREAREAHQDATGHGHRRNQASTARPIVRREVGFENRPQAGSAASNQFGTFTVHHATEKQTTFIARLLDQKDLSSVERVGLLDVATLREQVAAGTVNKRAASAIIDALLALPDATAAAAPTGGAQSTPKQRDFLRRLLGERAGNPAAEALRDALNIRFAEGTVTSSFASQVIDALLAIDANKGFELNKGDIHIVDGKYVRIHISQSSGKPYACVANILREAVWADGKVVEPGEVEWDYAAGLTTKLSETTRATAEQAKQFATLAGRCVFCSHAIDTPESTAVGYGPVCAGKFGLPWGSTVEVVAQTDPES